jgi:hypothetical protein
VTDIDWSETPTARVQLREDGILELRIKDGAYDTLETAVLIERTIDSLVGPSGHAPLMVVIGQGLGASEEARRLWAARQPGGTVTCIALVVRSPVSRVFGNMYVRLMKWGVPVRLFTEEADALDWLREPPP